MEQMTERKELGVTADGVSGGTPEDKYNFGDCRRHVYSFHFFIFDYLFYFGRRLTDDLYCGRVEGLLYA